MKKVKFRYDGKTTTLEETSHAALFRSFFDWWKKKDIQATILGTFESGLRIMDEEYFEGTVIKKKNLQIAPDLYIITHITPAAMDKGILGFLDAVEAEVIEPKRVEKNKPKPTPAKNEETDEDEDDNEDEQEGPIEPVDEEEIKKAAELVAASMTKGGKKSSTKLNMSDLVKRKMKQRDDEIKARLAKGPQSKSI